MQHNALNKVLRIDWRGEPKAISCEEWINVLVSDFALDHRTNDSPYLALVGEEMSLMSDTLEHIFGGKRLTVVIDVPDNTKLYDHALQLPP